jgi:secondary thiamine-phosphate synthase enzyme
MTVTSMGITLKTNGRCDIIDITRGVSKALAESEVTSGTVTVFIAGSTAGVTTIEYESGVLQDLQEMFERIIPTNITYAHDQRWGDGNGYSHVRAAALGPSLTVPFVDKALTLGTWQQIVVVDFDNRPRSRQVVLQIMGE